MYFKASSSLISGHEDMGLKVVLMLKGLGFRVFGLGFFLGDRMPQD